MENKDVYDEEYYLEESIERLDVYYSYIKALMKAGIETIGDLVRMPKSNVVNILNDVNGLGYSAVRRALMSLGLVFDFDKELYENFNIPKELILVKIAELPLNQRLINALRDNNIIYLGDLLVTSYSQLTNLRRVGKTGVKELLAYVHTIGFTLIGERREADELIEDYKNAGIPLVGEVLGLSNSAAFPLYRAHIFTMDDFLTYGPNVFNLIGVGKTISQEIISAMEKQGITFRMEKPSNTFEEEISKSMVISENIKNEEIRKRIERKNELAEEFKRLLLEREELIRKERELDEKITYAIKAYKALGGNDGVTR